MLASNDNSYMKEYVRRQRVRATRDVNGRPGGVAGEKLLTDRGEYIRFLESQLDAVTQACLTAQSFDERILSLGAASVAHDEKILNLARLIKCSQGVAEEQEAAYRAALDRVHRRVAECERAARKPPRRKIARSSPRARLLAKKGLVGGAEPAGADGTSRDTPTAALDVGVLDAQFRAWAEAHERATDAKLLAAENRLAARVDAAVADVLDAVRNAERRLTEEAPRLAEGAARTVWGKIGGERGTLPRGGVASGGDVRDVRRTRVEMRGERRRTSRADARGARAAADAPAATGDAPGRDVAVGAARGDGTAREGGRRGVCRVLDGSERDARRAKPTRRTSETRSRGAWRRARGGSNVSTRSSRNSARAWTRVTRTPRGSRRRWRRFEGDSKRRTRALTSIPKTIGGPRRCAWRRRPRCAPREPPSNAPQVCARCAHHRRTRGGSRPSIRRIEPRRAAAPRRRRIVGRSRTSRVSRPRPATCSRRRTLGGKSSRGYTVDWRRSRRRSQRDETG